MAEKSIKAAQIQTLINNIKSRFFAKAEAYEVGTMGSTQQVNLSTMPQVNLAISSLPNNPSSIALDSSASRTYQLCAITTRTSITLSGGNANAGYEHYILFYNSGSSDCVITKAANMLGPDTITVPSGKRVELSYIYNNSNVVITNSAELA